jgi:hypothetical protein
MSWANPKGTQRACLAIDASSNFRFGYVVRYPSGPVLHGEYDVSHDMLDAVDQLLQNGLPWQVLVGLPCVEHVSGALWYLAAKHGAEFIEREAPTVTDGQLRNALLWRRGMSAANRAARLLTHQGDAQ